MRLNAILAVWLLGGRIVGEIGPRETHGGLPSFVEYRVFSRNVV